MNRGQVKHLYSLLPMVVAPTAKKEVHGDGVRKQGQDQWLHQSHGLND